jgi:hypothetical protein
MSIFNATGFDKYVAVGSDYDHSINREINEFNASGFELFLFYDDSKDCYMYPKFKNTGEAIFIGGVQESNTIYEVMSTDMKPYEIAESNHSHRLFSNHARNNIWVIPIINHSANSASDGYSIMYIELDYLNQISLGETKYVRQQ